MNKQERIMMNCMTGRGYRALDSAFVIPAAYAAPVQAAVPAPTTGTGSPYYTPQPADPARVVAASGQDKLQAESFAKSQMCAATPYAYLAVKGPGFETYSVACASGDTMMVRCEFGNCRALR